MNLDHLDWPFFDDDASRARARARGLDRAQTPVADGGDVDAVCRAWVHALGAAGYLRHCVPAAYGGARHSLDSRALCVARETLAYARRPRRLRVRDAGAGQRSDHAGRQRGPARRDGCRAWRGARRSRPSRSPSRTRAPTRLALSTQRRRATATAGDSTAARRGSATAASPTSTACSRGPAGSQGAAASPRSSCPRTRPGSAIAERIDVIAPHPLARIVLDGCRVPRRGAARRGGRGLQARHAHARHLPCLGGRRGTRLRASRAGRGRCTRVKRGACSAARSASSRSRRRCSARWRAQIDAAALLICRAAWQRDVAAGPHDARGGDGQAASRPSPRSR